MAKQTDADYNIAFKRQSFLLSNEFIPEFCAAAKSDDPVFSYHTI
jgi:hypothetical protein